MAEDRKTTRRPFTVLLLSVLLLIVVQPLWEQPDGSASLTGQLVASGVLLAGVYAMADRPRLFRLALVLAALAFVARWIDHLDHTVTISTIATILWTLFAIVMTWGLFRTLLRAKTVTGDELAGVAAIYLLLAATWALVYGLVQIYNPGSFAGDELPLSGADRMYFSIVTITTLGYGGITPVGPAARVFAMLEAVTGVLFVAIVIARFAGLYGQRAED